MTPPNRNGLASQQPGLLRRKLPRPRNGVGSKVSSPVTGRSFSTSKQSGHALVRSAQATAWHIKLSKLGTKLQQALWHSLGFSPTIHSLEAALNASRLQLQEMAAELTQTKAAVARLRDELAGTQAGERTARHQAMHDGLTALPNRRMFMAQLEKALCQHAHTHLRPSVMYLDIDDFKLINDEHGHQVGDGVLRTVGARLAKSIRAGDMVARLGGDEFACLLQANLTQPQLLALAKKLCNSIAAPMRLDNLTLITHASIGLARYPADGETADTLLDRADAAMYQAKQQHTQVMFASEQAADPVDTGQRQAATSRGC